MQEERFKITSVKDDIVIFESSVHDSFYLHASSKTADEQVNWAQSIGVDKENLESAPIWSKYRLHPIKDGIFALESVRWPGYFVQDLSVPFGSVPQALKLKQTSLATAKAQLYLQFNIV